MIQPTKGSKFEVSILVLLKMNIMNYHGQRATYNGQIWLISKFGIFQFHMCMSKSRLS